MFILNTLAELVQCIGLQQKTGLVATETFIKVLVSWFRLSKNAEISIKLRKVF